MMNNIVRLIHLNGPPGVGKSSLGERFAERTGAAVVEIDAIRTQIDGWESDEGSKLVARERALELISAHLRGGSDVVVPQYLGRLDFIDRLEAVALAVDASFLEVMIAADATTAATRFRTRRRALKEAGTAHPQDEIAENEIAPLVNDAVDRLVAVARSRSDVVSIEGHGSLDDMLEELINLIHAQTS